MKNFETLSTEELINVKGGAWDGRCGIKVNGNWSCGTESEGYSLQNVQWSYIYDASTTAWCCASCSNASKCGPEESISPVE